MYMKSIKILLVAVLPFILGKCYEDKGSYDYKQMSDPQVSGLEYTYYVGLGETIKINPTVTYPGGNKPVVSYEWNVNGQIISTDSVLLIEQYAGSVGSVLCSFNVVNEVEGVKYMTPFQLKVTPTYGTGWLILANRDGKSELSCIRFKNETEDGETKVVYEEFPNVYEENTGESLGQEPLKMVEHWCFDYTRMGQILVINKKSDCVELDGSSLSKVVTVKQEFIDEKYPKDFKVTDALYVFDNSYLVTENGHVYSRKNEDVQNFQTGRYSQEPVYVQDSLSVTRVVPSLFQSTYHVLMYDGYNRRFLWVNAFSSYQPGKISPVSYTGYKPGFTPLDNLGDKDLVYCGYYVSSEFATSGYITILKSDAGKYYIQDFQLYAYMMVRVNDIYEKEFVGGSLLKADSKIVALPKRNYLFFTSDDKLYYYDRLTGLNPTEYVGFEGVKIKSIYYNKDNTQIAVGLENGKFNIYDITDSSLAKKEPVLVYEAKNNYGEIVDVMYKYGSLMNYMY